jgi:outer membrane immunogenic protein
MKKLLIAGTALTTLLSVPAIAADLGMYRKAPVIAAPIVTNWSGFYIGANVGGASGNVNWFDSVTGARVSTHDTFGGLGGGQVGYNFQFSSWVFGVEADFDWTNISGSTRCPNPAFICQSNMDYFSTIRGRLGYSTGPILFYATGGAAFTEQRYETIGPVAATTGGQSRTQTGWVAGAGIEWMPIAAFPALSVKAEWLHYDFDRDEVFTFPTPPTVTAQHRGELIRFGVNYRFNLWSPAVMASY